MPTREPELYKDKIEVSLDGRQIFYLFFGGAVLVGVVFVLGVMVGRRVESRSHVDRLDHAGHGRAASDPLAALDGLESKKLTFQDSLTKTETKTAVEHQIDELAKVRLVPEDKKEPKAVVPEKAADKPEKGDKAEKADKADKADKDKKKDKKAEPVTKPEQAEPAPKPEVAKADKPKAEPKPEVAKLEPVAKAEPKPDVASKSAESKKPKKEAKPIEERVNADVITAIDKPEDKPKTKLDEKGKFTLQLSSFQDKQEAETFLSSVKAAGYQAYVTEAEVSGKGTFYRVRMGTYRSLDAANDAKADIEKAIKKSASVMRL